MQSPQIPPPGGPPNIRPSYFVHITATQPDQIGTRSTGGPTWITSSGFRLRDLLGVLHDLPANRIDFDDPQLADHRLDVAMRTPTEESQKSMRQRIVNALEQQLGITIRPATPAQNIYAITIADRAKLESHTKAGGIGYIGTHTQFVLERPHGNSATPEELERLMRQRIQSERARTGISLDSIDMEGTVEDLCRVLEEDLQHPVLDRTSYDGILKLFLQRDGLDRDHFFRKIKAEFGLAISPTRAQVERLAVTRAKARNE